MLVENWKKISLVGYSAWAFYALALVTLAPDFIYKFFEVDTNPVVWGRLQLIIIVAGLVGRLLNQPKESRWRRRFIVGFILLVSCLVSLPAMAQNRDDIAVELKGAAPVNLDGNPPKLAKGSTAQQKR